MNNDRLMQVLLAPIVSEKSTMIGEKNHQVAFRVMQDATKPEVKAAVELLFKVNVEAVNVVNIQPGIRKVGRHTGRTRGERKAYVTLKAGQEINFAEIK
jgi:large subunit ribosomal protein L23